ncbi:helix-turn-helix transcriptional regulator [Paenibacillus rigui]|uniref:Transcriptional regulator n=1 Tax=Paenibacillus rigui TaxID=554312 RepID=A0A229UN66_9BACL|nr:YafY family protein [Paenibacillus rigui]OXM84821.1 transcriptional regulator [Paenibacillus rigui]
MNKTDRMLAIVLELQRKGTLRAEDLAAVFETSLRTIYRDMQALSEAGVPVIGAPGTGYSLMEGYFLPPVRFTADEAVAMLIGMDFIEQQFDDVYGAHAKACGRKIEAVLPEEVRKEAGRVRTTIKLLATREDIETQRQEGGAFASLRSAILEQRKVHFHYSKGPNASAAEEQRETTRVAAPYGLVLVRGAWMLIAYCELRMELRHFRVSRISGLSVLEERFQLPEHFNLDNYKPVDDRRLIVKVQLDASVAEQVKHAGSFYMETIEPAAKGPLVTFRVRQPEDVLHWIMGWGAKAVVLEPESLRQKVREEAENMIQRY